MLEKLKVNILFEKLLGRPNMLMITLLLVVVFFGGCGKFESSVIIPSTEISSQTEEQPNHESIEESTEESIEESIENSDIEWKETIEINFAYDYTEDIKADVDYIVSDSTSLQEELTLMEKIIEKYTPLSESAQTQVEMNAASKWFFVIWDTELNNLWSRFSNSADQGAKERVLAEQRNWITMKEEVTMTAIGSSEQSGSIYPLLENTFLEEITKNRAYILANELAEINGESFDLPEKSEHYGVYVDNQGTGSVYSSLVIRQGMEGNDEAVISLYRLGETSGSFADNGNSEIAFTSYDESVKGIIKIDGWNGASFKVTETAAESIFTVGGEFEFPFVF